MNADVLLVDTSTIWFVAGGIVLGLAIVGFGINYNIRRSREATEQQTRKLTQELNRLRSAGAGPSGDPDAEALRKAALREALRREPQLADTTDPSARERLSALVNEIESELRIEREVAQIRAEEERESRRLEAAREAARRVEEDRQRTEALLRKQEEERLTRRLARDQQLARMSPFRRWAVTHRGVVIAGVLGTLTVVALVAAAINAAVQSSRVAAEQAAASASAAAEQEASAQASEAFEELRNACDLERLDEAATEPKILAAWTKCDDAETAVKAASALSLASPARYAEVDLRGYDLSGLDLSGVSLPGIRFDNEDLSGTNFSGANLTAARLFSTDLSGADLSGANLEGASFSNANLSGSDLSGANLSNALIVRTNIAKARFDDANLEGVVWRDIGCTNGKRLEAGETTKGRPPC